MERQDRDRWEIGKIGEIEEIARAAYDACHRGDTFDDLKRRAAFSKEDRGLLREWLAAAAAKAFRRS